MPFFQRHNLSTLRVLSLVSVAVFIGCADMKVQSNWALKHPTIDGSLDEWNTASFVIFEDLHVSLGVGNDSTFLYLGGRVANRTLQRMVERSGISIWLDSEGTKEKHLEIRFPSSSIAHTDFNRGGFWGSMTEEEQKKVRQEAEESSKGLLIIDRRMVDSRIFKPGNARGYEGMIASSQGLTSFEVRIPLQLEDDFPKIRSLAPGIQVALGFELGGSIDRFQNAAMQTGPPSVENGSGGMEIPKGRGSSLRRPPGQDSKVQDGKEFWLEVSLAMPR